MHITPAGGDGSGGYADDGERQKDVTLLQWMRDHVQRSAKVDAPGCVHAVGKLG